MPTPGWLPVTPGEPLRAALIFGAIAALAGSGIGILIDISARLVLLEDDATQRPID